MREDFGLLWMVMRPGFGPFIFVDDDAGRNFEVLRPTSTCRDRVTDIRACPLRVCHPAFYLDWPPAAIARQPHLSLIEMTHQLRRKPLSPLTAVTCILPIPRLGILRFANVDSSLIMTLYSKFKLAAHYCIWGLNEESYIVEAEM